MMTKEKRRLKLKQKRCRVKLRLDKVPPSHMILAGKFDPAGFVKKLAAEGHML
jgi:hypothetical protein